MVVPLMLRRRAPRGDRERSVNSDGPSRPEGKVPMKTIHLLLSVLLIPNVAAADPISLIRNPGFEAGSLDPWFQGRVLDTAPVELWNVTSADAHTGRFSTTAVGNVELRQDFNAIETNFIKEISFWFRVPNSNGRVVAADLFYTDAKDEFIRFTHGTDWEFFDVTGELRPDRRLLGFSVFGYRVALNLEVPRVLLDDVTLSAQVPSPTPEPTSAVMLSTVVLGWAARRLCYRRSSST
jgi:hypothetical protein